MHSPVIHDIIYKKTIPRRDWRKIFKCYDMIGARYIPLCGDLISTRYIPLCGDLIGASNILFYTLPQSFFFFIKKKKKVNSHTNNLILANLSFLILVTLYSNLNNTTIKINLKCSDFCLFSAFRYTYNKHE